MNNDQFDKLTRRLAKDTSRRQMLKLLVGSVAGLVSNHYSKIANAQSGKKMFLRPIGSDNEPIAPDMVSSAINAAITCLATNNLSMTCRTLLDPINGYIKNCGVICPNGTRRTNAGGCTTFLVTAPPDPTTDFLSEPIPDGGLLCYDAVVSWSWELSIPPSYNTIHFTPSNQQCCPDVCKAEIADVLKQLEVHEQGHVNNIYNAFEAVHRDWNPHIPFHACGITEQQALDNLRAAIKKAQDETASYFKTATEVEPPQARTLQCSLCDPPSNACQACQNGKCVSFTCPTGQRCCNGGCTTDPACCTPPEVYVNSPYQIYGGCCKPDKVCLVSISSLNPGIGCCTMGGMGPNAICVNGYCCPAGSEEVCLKSNGTRFCARAGYYCCNDFQCLKGTDLCCGSSAIGCCHADQGGVCCGTSGCCYPPNKCKDGKCVR